MSDYPKPVLFLAATDFKYERVLPIRNLVIDPSKIANADLTHKSTGSTEHSSVDNEKEKTAIDGHEQHDPQDTKLDPNDVPPPHNPAIPSEDTTQKLSQPYVETQLELQDGGVSRPVSERAQVILPASGPPNILQGKVGRQEQTHHRCEDEPIHTPGAVQSFGALIALKYNADQKLEVRVCSENSASVLGYDPEQLFRMESFVDALEADSAIDLVSRVSLALSTPIGSEDTHLEVFPISMNSSTGSLIRFWCAIHRVQSPEEFIVCEFEDFSDSFYLKSLDSSKALPSVPARSMDIDATPEEQIKSTTSRSKPLRILQVARERESTEISSMDIFSAMAQAQQQLGAAKSLPEIFDVVVGLVAELTGFHRVMFYRFDAQNNGCVEAELVDLQASSDLFRGLHYPASDIPKQARDLYKLNRIRILHDRDAETARLVCRDTTDTTAPLDLTYSLLRAMSPIHLKYLGNMGVRSSMSISIVVNSELWGLIACHEYGDVGLKISLPIRELCRNIGEIASSNVDRLIMLSRIEARRPPVTAPPTQSPEGFISASSADLLRVFDADFGLLSIQEEARAIGRLDPYGEALVILAYLQSRRFTSIVSSQNINEDFPETKAQYEPGIHTISGLLLIPLSVGGNDFLVFFRKGQLKHVCWAGNPYEKVLRAGSQYVEPRTSFKRWTESVVGKSKQWNEDQLETATVLGLLYGRFIEIWRQKESASQSSRMTRLLIRNAGHEVRTPLNAIVNYLEMALENKLDYATRDLIEKAHKASRSLIYVIDDLLNLAKAEDNPVNTVGDTFDLGATVSDVITDFRKEAIRKGLDLTVSTHQGIPEMVKGDASRLRQVLSNITSNAFQHSVQGGIKVDIQLIRTMADSSLIGITVQDAGIGMSETQLDDLFLEFEQVVDEDARSYSAGNSPGTGGASLGVGLAVVARYVRNMNGQIRVNSELGKGTIFGLELQFDHASPPHSSQNLLAPQLDFPFPMPLSNIIPSNSLFASPEIPPEENTQEEPSQDTREASDSRENHLRSFSSSSLHNTMLSERSISEPEDSKPSAVDINAGIANSKRALSVLIAEDNPINARLLTKRLLKLGHKVDIAIDGQECHDQFSLKLYTVDVILMDIQMPLVDGTKSTQMIRQYEEDLKDLLQARPRVPIIAVSASLTENNRFNYLQSGFDAWILKPINFERLELLLHGITNQKLRQEALYTPGHWEKGGWFMP